MHFALTDDQQMIRDAAESFLADAADPAAVRRMIESRSGFDDKLWQRIGGELGWCGIAIAEAHGGLGLGAVEIALVQEQIGRRLLGGPFFPTVCLGATLVDQAAVARDGARLLAAIASGQMRASVPLDEDHFAATRVAARSSGSAWSLDGRCARVPEGESAEIFFIPARLPTSDIGVFAVERRMVKPQPVESWDATRRFVSLDLQGTLGERVDDPSRAAEGLSRATALARIYIAAEQLGGAQQCLDSTVAYVATRKQFGRAIGSFQAVKHRCAELMVRIEATRSMVYGAAAQAASGASTVALAQECAAAKALASETYFHCAQEAIQLHGGVGFTWEFDAQLHFKRAQASGHWLGAAAALHRSIAGGLIAA